MYRIKIISIGKNKESWLKTALMQIQWLLKKKDSDLKKTVLEEKKFHCLDPNGISYTSEGFSKLITQNASITLVIGGALGIDDTIKTKAQSLISLSPLTFTHQHTRLILLEQLYRAIEIHKGSDYHK